MCSWFTGVIVGMMVGIPRERSGGVEYSAPLLASWQEERMLRLVGLTLRSEARELTLYGVVPRCIATASQAARPPVDVDQRTVLRTCAPNVECGVITDGMFGSWWRSGCESTVDGSDRSAAFLFGKLDSDILILH